jgi:hypothetical protein
MRADYLADRRLSRAFAILYVTVGVVVLVQSIGTIVQAVRGDMPIADRPHAQVLGGSEALAAVLFLIPRTTRLGAVALLLIFALAFLLHALRGEVAWPLLAYGAAVFFVRAHGVTLGAARS